MAEDNFNRPDADDLGLDWVQYNPEFFFPHVLGIRSNLCAIVSNDPFTLVSWALWAAAFAADQYSQIEFIQDPSGAFDKPLSLLARADWTVEWGERILTRYYGARWTPERMLLQRFSGGALDTVADSGPLPTRSPGDLGEIRIVGGSLTGLINNIPVATYTDPAPLAAGQTGFLIVKDWTNLDSMLLDNWQGGPLAIASQSKMLRRKKG